MVRRIKTCITCRRRYISASGTSACPRCRSINVASEKINKTASCTEVKVTTELPKQLHQSEPSKYVSSSSSSSSDNTNFVKNKALLKISIPEAHIVDECSKNDLPSENNQSLISATKRKSSDKPDTLCQSLNLKENSFKKLRTQEKATAEDISVKNYLHEKTSDNVIEDNSTLSGDSLKTSFHHITQSSSIKTSKTSDFTFDILKKSEIHCTLDSFSGSGIESSSESKVDYICTASQKINEKAKTKATKSKNEVEINRTKKHDSLNQVPFPETIEAGRNNVKENKSTERQNLHKNGTEHFTNEKEQSPYASNQLNNSGVSCTSKIPKEHTGPRRITGDICSMCGTDLSRISTGIKGRVNHFKRCSKKYGVTIRDVKHDDDEEYFVSTAEEKISITANKKWHGNAEVDLSFIDTMEKCGNEDESKTEARNSRQTSLTSFFPAPSRSLNKVLMAGARKMAKTAEIISSKSNQTMLKAGKKSFFQNRKRNFVNGQCPSYKRITGTDFICDGFQYATKVLSTNYFLTHFHSDHYGGISKHWDAGVIYCSLSTANLVNQQLGVDKKYLHPLPLMIPTVIESRGKPVTVTLLDANHCPGAVMFLYEVGNRMILHVGDFRWNRTVMLRQSPLHACSVLRHRLDELFLDTTYCNEKFSGIPTQDEAINATIELLEKRLSTAKERNEKILLLFGSYTIGKERIYMSVAEKLGLKVYVDSRKYRILSALEWPSNRMNLLTTNKKETPIWVVPLGHIGFKHMSTYLEEANKKTGRKVFCNSSKDFSHVIGFRPTGWTFSGKALEKNKFISSRTSGNITVHGVPYSEHSNFSELVDCLRCLKPKKIIPTVSVSKSEEQIQLLLDALQKI